MTKEGFVCISICHQENSVSVKKKKNLADFAADVVTVRLQNTSTLRDTTN